MFRYLVSVSGVCSEMSTFLELPACSSLSSCLYREVYLSVKSCLLFCQNCLSVCLQQFACHSIAVLSTCLSRAVHLFVFSYLCVCLLQQTSCLTRAFTCCLQLPKFLSAAVYLFVSSLSISVYLSV